MKYIIILTLLINSVLFSQNIVVEGKVFDSESNMPLVGANVVILNTSFGVSTSDDGKFLLSGTFTKIDSLSISYIGYKPFTIKISQFLKTDGLIKLILGNVKISDVLVMDGLIAKNGITPAAFSKITRKEIEDNYTVQDLPEYLSYLPSTTFYSEGGNGLGYNYLSIRGFDQRRISISVNGIPQNDPEDHNLYWLDMPDLLESTGLLQVQRGAGSGMIGYPSIGGSINIITSPFSDKPKFELSSMIGSYNTRKYSGKFSSGLINNKYSVYVKLSKTLSDGYRDNSWIDFNSYHVSAVRYDKNVTTQINLFGGPISDGLAYYGMPKSFIKDKQLRKSNVLTKNEIENFSQPHYDLLNEIKLSNTLTLNTALFLIIGDGFFDYDGSWSIYYDDYFRLKESSFDNSQKPTNSLIHAVVNNKQWGFIPRLTWKHNGGTLITGLEYRNHRSKHWGNIKFAENIPADVSLDYQYYYYEGGNDIFNFFVNENYNISNKINVLGEIQLAYHNYQITKEKFVGNDFTVDGLYFNPKIGINYKFNTKVNAYFSFAKVTREPRLKNYYYAAESSGGEVPQFETNSNGSYNFDKPLVNPETMLDFELGSYYSTNNFALNVNLFYMLFNDEIVKSGQLDRFGQPITGNVDKSIHTGVEVESNFRISKNFDFIINGTYSRNYISDGSTFVNYEKNELETTEELSLTNNAISGFPEITMNAILRGHYKGLSFQLSGKFVGDYFSDNYDENLSSYLKKYTKFVSYSDNKVDSYLVVNFIGSYEFAINGLFKKVRVFGQVNNLFDNLYAAYADGADFFPAAERNVLFGLKLGL